MVDEALALWIVATTLQGRSLAIKFDVSAGKNEGTKHPGMGEPLLLTPKRGGLCEAAKGLLLKD